MSELIVLGLIPGTHIQITFVLWLLVAITPTSIILIRGLYRSKALRRWLIITSFLLATRRRLPQPGLSTATR
jgi:hypothetical protein